LSRIGHSKSAAPDKNGFQAMGRVRLAPVARRTRVHASVARWF
jgi:hypothetical protein